MAVRQADNTLIDRMIQLRNDAAQLELDLRRHGDRESAAVVKRAGRELQAPAFTAVANRAGRAH